MTLYKFLLNAFPILFPPNLPLSAQLSRLASLDFTSIRSPSYLTSLSYPPTPTSNFNPNSLPSSALDDDDDEDNETPSPSSSPLTIDSQRTRARAGGTLLAHRRARLSTTAQMRQVWVRKKTRRWHAVVAGAIAGGLAILFERSKGGRRTVIAQQLFVRFAPFLLSRLPPSSLWKSYGGNGGTDLIDGHRACGVEGCKDHIMRSRRSIILVFRMGMLSSFRSGMSLPILTSFKPSVTIQRLIVFWNSFGSCGQILYGFLRTRTRLFTPRIKRLILSNSCFTQYGRIHFLDHT